MGQCSSKDSRPMESVPRPDSPSDTADPSFDPLPRSNSDRSRSNTGGRPSSSGIDELGAQELQEKLEHLDEERAKLVEVIRRRQAVDLAGADSAMNGARVRFSTADPEASDVGRTKGRQPMPPDNPRRYSGSFGSLGSALGVGRVSTYNQPTRFETKEQLVEMLKRSRRRTRFNHRSSEGGSSGALLPSSTVTYLPRGGVHVQTKYGAVQVPSPPHAPCPSSPRPCTFATDPRRR